MKKICHFHVRCYERNYFKTKIWMAAIIINFIIKHHGLLTYRCIVLHENIKNYQYVCFPNDSRYKVIKNVSIQYTYRR